MAHTSRRALLSASATAALASIAGAAAILPSIAEAEAAPSVHPDAELIALCAQIVDLERQWNLHGEVYFHLSPRDPNYEREQRESDRLARLKDPIEARINDLPTHTLAGFQARARAVLCSDYGSMEQEGTFGGMLWSLVHDLTETGEG